MKANNAAQSGTNQTKTKFLIVDITWKLAKEEFFPDGPPSPYSSWPPIGTPATLGQPLHHPASHEQEIWDVFPPMKENMKFSAFHKQEIWDVFPPIFCLPWTGYMKYSSSHWQKIWDILPPRSRKKKYSASHEHEIWAILPPMNSKYEEKKLIVISTLIYFSSEIRKSEVVRLVSQFFQVDSA